MNRKLGGNKWGIEILCIAFVLAGAGLFIHGIVEFDLQVSIRECRAVIP